MKYPIIVATAMAALSSMASETNTVSNTETYPSQTILVTATRSIRPTDTVPVHASVISGEKIAQQHYKSVPEALSKEAGIYFRNFADNPSQANVDMRGFGENSHGRVLVLLNGRKVNNPDLATVNWSQINLRNIERIEVLRGPGTAMYGDNANGGVINIITTKASDTPQLGADVSVGSYGFNDETVYVSGRVDGLGYFQSFNHQSADGYRDQSKYENYIWSMDLDSALTDRIDGRLSISGVGREYELPGDLTAAQKNANRRQSVDDSDVEDRTLNADLGLAMQVNSDQALYLDGGVMLMEQSANLDRQFGPFATYLDVDKTSGSVSPKYTTTTMLGRWDNELTVGSDIRYEKLDVELFADEARNVPGNHADVEQTTTDLYALESLYLSDDLILSGAGRLSWSSVDVKEHTPAGATVFDDSKNRSQQAASAGITWLPEEGTKLYAKADRFYRYPFVDEQASYLGFLPSAFIDLEPETGYNLEIGSDVAVTENLNLQASAYYMPMKNEIAFNPSTFANENLDDTVRTGVELGAGYTPVRILTVRAGYTLTLSEFDSGVNKGNQVPGVPTHRARAEASLLLTDRLTLTADVRYTGKQYPINDNGNNADTFDSYILTDIKLGYANVLKKCNYELYVGVDNVFATEYDYYQISNAAGTTVNYYPAAERTWKAGVAVLF